MKDWNSESVNQSRKQWINEATKQWISVHLAQAFLRRKLEHRLLGITTTHLSYSVLSLKLPPPPRAVLMVFLFHIVFSSNFVIFWRNVHRFPCVFGHWFVLRLVFWIMWQQCRMHSETIYAWYLWCLGNASHSNLGFWGSLQLWHFVPFGGHL